MMLLVNMCMCVCLSPSHFLSPTYLSFHTCPAGPYTLLSLLKDANIANDKAPEDSSQTKHFLSKAVHLYAVCPKQGPRKVGVFLAAFIRSQCLLCLLSLVWQLIMLF